MSREAMRQDAHLWRCRASELGTLMAHFIDLKSLDSRRLPLCATCAFDQYTALGQDRNPSAVLEVDAHLVLLWQ